MNAPGDQTPYAFQVDYYGSMVSTLYTHILVVLSRGFRMGGMPHAARSRALPFQAAGQRGRHCGEGL